MTQPSTPRPVALATLVLVTMTAASCGHSSPVAPDAAAAPSEAAAAAPATLTGTPGSGAASTVETFPLSSGTFTISGRKGGTVTGVYSGETTELNGVSVTTLKLEVTGGTGSLAGAAGVLDGKGTGAFTGEGTFALEVSGFVSTDGKKKTKFSAALLGSSTLACESGHVIVSLHASAPNELRHEVGNAGCF
jgi:hypothetical protein